MGEFKKWAVLLSAGLAAAQPAAAQQGRPVAAQLSMAAGTATDVLGVRASAITVTPTVFLRPSARFALDLGIQGTGFANREWAATGVGALGLRAPVTRWLAFTANGSGALTSTSYDSRYSSIAVIPALEGSIGPVTAYAGGHVAHGSSSVPHDIGSASPLPVDGGPTTSRTTASRVLRGAVYGAGTYFVRDGARGDAGYREERTRIGGIAYVDRMIHASVLEGRVTLAASIGARTSPAENAAFGSGTFSVAVRRDLAIQLAGARYPVNHLTGMQAGSGLSVGAVLTTGRRSAPTIDERATALRGVAAPEPGVSRLVIRAPRARHVELAGDWSDWKPVAARRAPDDYWYADIRIPPGRYRYAFRIDGSQWTVPEGVTAVDDGFGGRSAWLTVK